MTQELQRFSFKLHSHQQALKPVAVSWHDPAARVSRNRTIREEFLDGNVILGQCIKASVRDAETAAPQPLEDAVVLAE